MILVVAAAVLGGAAMFAMSLPYGLLVALLIASFGGSATALVAALVLAQRRSVDRRMSSLVTEQSDAMVTSLQAIADRDRKAAGRVRRAA